jgi:hypothetical protein
VAYRPFLSHKRSDASDLELLKGQLQLRGAGSWQDVDDLHIGQRFMAALKRSIGRETGGFIWWGTRSSLESRTICKVEVPTALRRQRLRREAYPVVPLFVDIAPDIDTDLLRSAFGKRRATALCARNGLVREPERESIADFAASAARRYVKDLVREHRREELRVAITGGREPTGGYDLVLDWRGVLDENGRLRDSTGLPLLTETLADIRNVAQSRTGVPRIAVEPHLRLPLAALVGWEWNRVRPIDLRVIQTSATGSMVVEDLDWQMERLPEPREFSFNGSGPHVVALSVGKNLGESVSRYASSIDACGAIHLHVDGPLKPAEICGVAGWAIEQLATLNSHGSAKHLLLLGPVSLAVRIGAAANGTGKTTIPFWDGSTGYGASVMIG